MCKRTFFVAVGLLATVACVDLTGPLPLGDGLCDEIVVLGRVAGISGGDVESHIDGRSIGRGGRVLITITVDPEKHLVSFEPYGLVFNRWSRSRPWLHLSYNTAGGDYDGDGDVDRVDSYLEENYLRLWERTPQSSELAGVDIQAQAGGSRWSPGDGDKSTKRNNFGSCVAKFSDVAVSW